MKLLGTHVYLGAHPDRNLSEAESRIQAEIGPSDGPREVVAGLLSVGAKSRRRIVSDNQLPARAVRNGVVNSEPAMAALQRSTYVGGRFYQGTTVSDALAKREVGMDPSTKTHSVFDKIRTNAKANADAPAHERNALIGDADGRADNTLMWASNMDETTLREAKEEVGKHLYFSRLKSGGRPDRASFYAVIHSTAQDPPALLRTYLVGDARRALGMERVSHSNAEWLTGADVRVPAGYVLPSKNSVPVAVTLASEDFKHSFNGNRKQRRKLVIDTVIGSQRAAEMLHDAQTPSPTDEFPALHSRWSTFDPRLAGSTNADVTGGQAKGTGPAHAVGPISVDDDAILPSSPLQAQQSA